jgi:predicted metalloprotease
MLWRNRRESGNVVDRRGMGGPIGIGGLLIGAVFYYLMGGNPLDYIVQNSSQVSPQQKQQSTVKNDDDKKFVSVILADTEDVWTEIFKSNHLVYQDPKLVLFTNGTRSACGNANSSMGPFYCPQDNEVYLDLGFFRELQKKLGANGDFAIAYVIAHEVGHHVQNLLHVSSPTNNRESVKYELEADCLSGVWSKQTEQKNLLEKGDLEEALNAASAVGDDRLQKATRGEVVPDSFTHGTSAQRMGAFNQGYSEGNPQACLDAYKI